MSSYGIGISDGQTLLLMLRREITYDGENYKWGFQIGDSEQRHQWFKLALDPSQARASSLASRYVDPLAFPPPYNAEKLVTDFMTALRQHFERVLRHSFPKSTLHKIPIEYIVCSWGTRARYAVVHR